MAQVTSHKILVAIHGLGRGLCLFDCYQGYSESYEWILMKCSGKTEDGASNKPLNFGSNSWAWQRFALSKCF